jgi:hypothetical protein
METIMIAPCGYLHLDGSGAQVAKGEADVQLESERLLVLPKLGEPIYLSLVDILEFSSNDYKLELQLPERERLVIYDLGYRFDDFMSNLSSARNEMILRYLLMNESIRKSGVLGDLKIIDSSGGEKTLENCSLRLYETSIVFIPPVSRPIKLLYALIDKSEVEEYALRITTQSGEGFLFSKMGSDFDSTVSELSSAINSLNVQTQTLVKQIDPLAEPATVRGIARLLRDGRAATRSEIEKISPAFWDALEKEVEPSAIWRSYQFLKSIARQQKIAAGIKRGLMGELTGNYLWLLVPLYGADNPRWNAIAMEATRVVFPAENAAEGHGQDEISGGNATYFFRIAGRSDFSFMSVEELDYRVDGMIRNINQLMLDINFRREPIFLSDEQLRDPRNARYRYAIQSIPSLKELRHLYIGRVIHSSFDQWKTDVTDLLSFNASTNDDRAKWKKR